MYFVLFFLSWQQGVAIPGLGTFTFSQVKLDVGNNKFLLLQRPVFVLQEKFVQTHALQQNRHNTVPGSASTGTGTSTNSITGTSACTVASTGTSIISSDSSLTSAITSSSIITSTSIVYSTIIACTTVSPSTYTSTSTSIVTGISSSVSTNTNIVISTSTNIVTSTCILVLVPVPVLLPLPVLFTCFRTVHHATSLYIYEYVAIPYATYFDTIHNTTQYLMLPTMSGITSFL